jgi:hypothetical protein
MAGAIILKISYGYDVMEHNDPFLDLAARAVDKLDAAAATRGAHMVDFIPACTSFGLPIV